jgi:hypothetical protein
MSSAAARLKMTRKRHQKSSSLNSATAAVAHDAAVATGSHTCCQLPVGVDLDHTRTVSSSDADAST